MSDSFEMRPIARIRSDFGSKFGVPRQSGLVDALEAAVVFEEPYRNPDALRGLEGFSHIWLIWAFHQSQRPEWSPQSGRPGWEAISGWESLPAAPLPAQSHRPLLRAAGPHRVHGRLGPGAPCPWRRPGRRHPHPGHQALPPLRRLPPGGRRRLCQRAARPTLEVEIPPALLDQLPPDRREALRDVLALDPRPRYQQDPDRVYGFLFAGQEVRFTVDGDRLQVVDIK